MEGPQGVHPAPVGEEEQGIVGIHHHQVHQGVIFPGGHSAHPLAAPVLGAVGIAGDALDVPLLTQGNHHVLVRNELLGGLFSHFFRFDSGAAGVAKVPLQLAGFLLDFVEYLFRAGQQFFQRGDGLEQVGVFLFQPFPLQSGQSAQLHIEDGLGLDLRQVKLGHQIGSGGLRVVGAADDSDYLVHNVQGQQQPLQDMVPVPRPLEPELGAAPDNLLPVLHKEGKGAFQGQHLGLAADQGEHDDVEGRTQGGVAEQVVPYYFGLGFPAQLNNDAHTLPVRLVPDVGNSLNPLVPNQLGNFPHQVGLVDLVGQFGNDYALAPPANLFDFGLGFHYDAAPPGGVGVNDALGAPDNAAGRKVRPWHQFQQVLGNAVRVVYDVAHCIADFRKIMRRKVGSHSYCDAGGAVD